MSERRIHVCSFLLFGRFKDYWFYPDTGKIKPFSDEDLASLPENEIESAMLVDGEVQRFIIGGRLVLYKDETGHFIQSNRKRWRLGDDRVCLRYHRMGPIGIFVIRSENYKKTVVIWRLFESISEVIDPTYDYLDVIMSDFACHVISIHNDLLGK